MASYTLFACKGTGSMIAEVAFDLAQIPVEIVDLDWKDTGWNSPVLGKINPLGQLPTVKMPDGTVLTESAAIVLHLADLAPDAGLAPKVDEAHRAEFLRWLVFLVAAVYPTFTYGDVPERFVEGDAAAGAKLKAGTDEHRKTLWRFLEGQVGSPWFLGDRFSALDVMLWPMTFWRPGRAWFAEECPKLLAIGVAMDHHPSAVRVAKRNGLKT